VPAREEEHRPVNGSNPSYDVVRAWRYLIERFAARIHRGTFSTLGVSRECPLSGGLRTHRSSIKTRSRSTSGLDPKPASSQVRFARCKGLVKTRENSRFEPLAQAALHYIPRAPSKADP
jgi:hypothetical protein